MKKFILGKKLGMTTIYGGENANNVTLVEAPVNKIVRICDVKKNGYQAIVLSINDGKKIREKEFRVDSVDDYKNNKEVAIDVFKEGDKVIIQSISKGKGYQGVVKKYNFAGSPASHGHRHDLRAPGSIGSAFPERVMKGKKMASRMGGHNVTVGKMKIVKVDKENSILAIKGAIPGNRGSIIKIVN